MCARLEGRAVYLKGVMRLAQVCMLLNQTHEHTEMSKVAAFPDTNVILAYVRSDEEAKRRFLKPSTIPCHAP
jgi:hypothetical protein